MYSFAHAVADAPAPTKTTLTSPILFPTISSAFKSAAEEMIAVPCWSSWNTGMRRRRFSSSSIQKHSGALMSSRLMPPKVGAIRATVSTKAWGSEASTSMSKTSMSAKRLKRIPFPSMTGLAASGPMLPSPRTAVPLEITATRFPLAVYSYAFSGSFEISRHGSATPGL
jgi:hypothetical protein